VKAQFSRAAHWNGAYDEPAIQQWAAGVRAGLASGHVTLGLVFIGPKFFAEAEQILDILRLHARIPLLVGCSGKGVITDGKEIEDDPGISLTLFDLPGAQLSAFHFTQEQVEQSDGPESWQKAAGIAPKEVKGWLVFADPFHLDIEKWLHQFGAAFPGLPILGGLSSGDMAEQRTQLYLNGDVFDEGGVGLAVAGDVRLVGVISQGCTPIGDTWTLTRVERNFIQGIANRPAYEVLAETFNALTPDEQKKSRGNLFIGLAMNEYLEDFHRGDFLIRNLLGADPNSGVVAVGALPRAGQTIQFQRRDPAAAGEDMRELLSRAQTKLSGQEIYGGCLCSCNGRGREFFGQPDHDAKLVQEIFGPLGVGGFFCNGEFGPVGGKNFIHGFTASLALFVKQ